MGGIFSFFNAILDKSYSHDDVKKGINSLGPSMNAITKMAKDAVFTYPVVISEGVFTNDVDLVYAITRYLETQYGVFTMISMGLNPILKDSNVKNHILTFYSEEDGEMKYDYDMKHDSFVKIVGNESYKIKIPESFFEEYKYSVEADMQTGSIAALEKEVTFLREKIKRTDSKDKETIKELEEVLAGKEAELVEKIKNIDTGKVKKGLPASVKTMGLAKKLNKTDPTLIEVEFNSSTGKVKIPLAIKAIPHVITSEESARIFTYLKEDKPLVRVIQLLSGELKLFRGLIFQLDRASKDKELYSKLGRHPWFRQLLERRNYRSVKGIASLIPFFSSFIKNPSEILPICSLVVTKKEIEEGMSNIWERIKKQNESFMEKMMLLCLCVVDTDTGFVEFDFYGLKNNTIYRDSTLKEDFKDGKASNDDMTKLIETLVHKV